MAKRTDKAPASAKESKTRSVQIPEAMPLPNPSDSIAASVPRLPSAPEITAATPQRLKPKPAPPSPADDYNPQEVQKAKASLLDPKITLTRPALSRMNHLGTYLLGDCAMANKLGNRQPGWALITKSEDRRWFYYMPIGHKHDMAVEISYRKSVANTNLWGPFEQMGKIIERGYRETFDLWMTDDPVTIHGVTGYALFFDLKHPDKRLQSRDEGTSGEAAAGKSSSTRAPRSTKKAASEPANESEAAPQTIEETAQANKKLWEMVETRDNTIDERDAEIEDLEKTIQAYRERFGPLE